MLQYEDLQQTILVGHSYGGSVVLAAADHDPQRIGQLVCLDSLLPDHGQSFRAAHAELYDTLCRSAQAEGKALWVTPPADWSFGIHDPAQQQWLQARLTPHPLITLHEPLHFEHPDACALLRSYIACTGQRSESAIAAHREHWQQRGWQYHALPTGHDAMVTHPEALAELLQLALPATA